MYLFVLLLLGSGGGGLEILVVVVELKLKAERAKRMLLGPLGFLTLEHLEVDEQTVNDRKNE